MPVRPSTSPVSIRFTEAGFRGAGAPGPAGRPSQAIFDPRSGQALGPGDWDLNPELKDDLAVMAPPRPAAVLVPIVLRDALTVLLTQRSHDMPSHPGQISFPGGKIEPFDADPGRLRAARGARGDRPGRPSSSSRSAISTAIAPAPASRSVRWWPSCGPASSRRARSARGARGVRGAAGLPDGRGQPPEGTRANGAAAQRSFYAMPYEGRYIWGATAGMLKNMHQRLFQR